VRVFTLGYTGSALEISLRADARQTGRRHIVSVAHYFSIIPAENSHGKALIFMVTEVQYATT
jgi:hypothetical protein